VIKINIESEIKEISPRYTDAKPVLYKLTITCVGLENILEALRKRMLESLDAKFLKTLTHNAGRSE